MRSARLQACSSGLWACRFSPRVEWIDKYDTDFGSTGDDRPDGTPVTDVEYMSPMMTSNRDGPSKACLELAKEVLILTTATR